MSGFLRAVWRGIARVVCIPTPEPVDYSPEAQLQRAAEQLDAAVEWLDRAVRASFDDMEKNR